MPDAPVDLDPHDDLDQRLLGLVPTEDALVWVLPLASHLCRPDGALFGGTALAASLRLMELATGRAALWATVQFVTSARVDDRLDCRVVIGARGHHVDQVRVEASIDGAVVFEALGSTADPRDGAMTGVGVTMPTVPPPDDCPLWEGPGGVMAGLTSVGHHERAEYRVAELQGLEAAHGAVAMWGRLVGEGATTSAKLGFLGDMVPLAVTRSAGVEGVGTSLDNSIRLARLVDSEWLLVHLQGHAAQDGYGYGVGHFWSPDGQLLATSSQTAKLFDLETLIRRHRDQRA